MEKIFEGKQSNENPTKAVGNKDNNNWQESHNSGNFLKYVGSHKFSRIPSKNSYNISFTRCASFV